MDKVHQKALERYADDYRCDCKTEKQAKLAVCDKSKSAKSCKLQLYEQKVKIVNLRDSH
jgi:hypothetical protein